jgi:uncharacterized membrane protein YhaH (DUF805 family)
VNTLVVQNSVPRRLLGVAMGAMFFSIMMGVAISPALLGPAMNVGYRRVIDASLPNGLTQVVDEATIKSLRDPRVLLSGKAMSALEQSLNKRGSEGRSLFVQTVQAVRISTEAGLRSVFWIGAVTMLLAFLIISTIPETSMEEVQEKESLQSVPVQQAVD